MVLRVCIFHCECQLIDNQKSHQIAFVEISKLILELNLLLSAQGHEELSFQIHARILENLHVVSCCDVEKCQFWKLAFRNPAGILSLEVRKIIINPMTCSSFNRYIMHQWTRTFLSDYFPKPFELFSGWWFVQRIVQSIFWTTGTSVF